MQLNIIRIEINGDKSTEEKFKEIAEAYEVLSDEQKRKEYDTYGSVGNNAGRMNANDIFSQFFGGSGFNSFENIFGKFNKRHNPNAPKNGDDILKDVKISLEDSYNGTTKEIEIDEYDVCIHCNGKGGETTICPMCNGRGVYTQQTGFFTVQGTCSHCEGSGVIISKKCAYCKGNGYTSKKSSLTFNIPAGAFPGMLLRIPRRGYPGKNGGIPGNLIFRIDVDTAANFVRNNDDIVTKYNVRLSDILLGNTKTIDIFGNSVTFKINKNQDLTDPIIIENKRI